MKNEYTVIGLQFQSKKGNQIFFAESAEKAFELGENFHINSGAEGYIIFNPKGEEIFSLRESTFGYIAPEFKSILLAKFPGAAAHIK